MVVDIPAMRTKHQPLLQPSSISGDMDCLHALQDQITERALAGSCQSFLGTLTAEALQVSYSQDSQEATDVMSAGSS